MNELLATAEQEGAAVERLAEDAMTRAQGQDARFWSKPAERDVLA